MSGFDDVNLEWAGQTYVIKRGRVLGAIARVEEVISLSELARIGRGKPPPMAKIAMAFGSVLRYAGAAVTDEEVYAGIFGATGSKADMVVSATTSLLAMMIPPEHLQSKDTSPGNGVPAAGASSRKRSSSRSARGR